MYKNGHVQKWPCTKMAMHKNGHVQKWSCTKMAMHKNGHAQKWQCTKMAMYKSNQGKFVHGMNGRGNNYYGNQVDKPSQEIGNQRILGSVNFMTSGQV